MAPPRPGWSRRAQYGLFFSFIAAIAGLAIGLILLAFSIAAPEKFHDLRSVSLDSTAPISATLNQVRTTVRGLASGAGNYWDAANQNRRLRRERDSMRQQLIRAKAIELENLQLKSALQLRDQITDSVAAGRLIGSSFESPRRFAILSAGIREGVQPGMPIRASDGLVGRVIDSAALASRILLVSDRASIVPSRLLRTGQAVIAQGHGDGTVDLKPLEVGRNPFRPGDIVITSGTGGLYPPNVPLARVIRRLGDNAVGIPLADPARISFAIAQQPYEPDAMAPLTEKDQELP